MSNRLKNETSPYLLQHAENPVDWYPWCEEAFEKAKEEDKPVFLSIGYSTCHWCHVMAHESFEDDKTAEMLNRCFISVKVDREERPDVDSVYMSVCQAFTRSGGWPMSIFMTWDKKPFFAGTYFPVHSQYGMPGFSDLLREIAEQWKKNRAELLRSAEEMIAYLRDMQSDRKENNGVDLAEKAVKIFSHTFDERYGGFGSAPKFPTPHNLLFLMLYAKQKGDAAALEMAEKTLIQMRKGGIFDHIGYGFSRYSTDEYFLEPHFEKMLYDNALLMMAYAIAYRITEDPLYLDTAEKTAEYILREMTSDDGGFYSAQDADSEGVEGRYYTFTKEEVISVLGREAGESFANAFDITSEGNFGDVNIPNLLGSGATIGFDEEIKTLYDYRKNRAVLHLDDKILLSWNALMIAALSMLYRVSKKEKYLQAAQRAQQFAEGKLCEGSELYTSFREGKRSEQGFLDDYAFYTASLIELYNSTLEKAYLEKAELFCAETIKRFADREDGGFFLCKTDNAELFMNPKESYDGAVPCGNSVMAYNFVRLYQLTEKEEYKELAKKQIAYMAAEAHEYPAGYSMFLISMLLYGNPPEHIAVVLKEQSDLERVKEELPLLANIVIVPESGEYPLVNGKTTYYVCKDHACQPPKNHL